MTLARSAAETMSTLRASIRRMVTDPSTDADGNAIAEASRKYADADIDESLNYTLIHLGNIATGQSKGEALLYTTVSYLSSSDPVSLGSTIVDKAVYKIEDRTDSNAVQKVQLVSAHELDDWENLSTWMPGVRRVGAIVATSTGYGLMVRPAPSSALSLRVFYIAAPLVGTAGDSSDSIFYSAQWKELIVALTALKLMSRDDEAPQQLQDRTNELLAMFEREAVRNKGTQRIRNARRCRA